MRRSVALAALALSAATAARAQEMQHPPHMTHNQVIQAASRGGPAFISKDATIAWIDSAANVHQMRAGTNGFTCVIARPDPFAGPICGDQNAAAWLVAFLKGASQPPTASAPGIAYMAAGGVHFEDRQRNVVMEHMLMKHAPGSHRVREPGHWMLIWPYDPATSGLPTKENPSGTYIMFAGTPWAHVMIYQNPNRMAPRGRRGRA